MEHYGVIYGFTDNIGEKVFDNVFKPCGFELDPPELE